MVKNNKTDKKKLQNHPQIIQRRPSENYTPKKRKEEKSNHVEEKKQ
jgi:hypothetical protein